MVSTQLLSTNTSDPSKTSSQRSLAPSWISDSAIDSYKRTRYLFSSDNVFIPNEDERIRTASIERRRRHRSTGKATITAPSSGQQQLQNQQSTALISLNNNTSTQQVNTMASGSEEVSGVLSLLSDATTKTKPSKSKASTLPGITDDSTTSGILVKPGGTRGIINESSVPIPTWHTPWKLSTVLSSHIGWVRCIGFDPQNTLFATGSTDRTIKIWNLPKACVGANDALQLTLTGHISPIRGLVFSPRHPYLFSCAEDKTVKCWDLETNQVIRHYHGHLSGVYCINLHPTLDVLVTGGRDAVARVWDIRSKQQIHCLSGHDHTVSSVLTKSVNPQIITGSHDCTIKLWDLIAGKCMTTLTHHNKAIRTLAMPSYENTFASGAADCIKKWQGKDGKFIQSIKEQNPEQRNANNVIVHTLSVNDDGILVCGRDDGSILFYDYKTGYQYQTVASKVQPGSIQSAENAVLTTSFDLTGTRLITGEADKTIKIYKPDDNASEITHPINIKEWRKTYISAAKERY